MVQPRSEKNVILTGRYACTISLKKVDHRSSKVNKVRQNTERELFFPCVKSVSNKFDRKRSKMWKKIISSTSVYPLSLHTPLRNRHFTAPMF